MLNTQPQPLVGYLAEVPRRCPLCNGLGVDGRLSYACGAYWRWAATFWGLEPCPTLNPDTTPRAEIC